jgi:aryl-alcohol dehydrogenase-like predicted oxidoreductase
MFNKPTHDPAVAPRKRRLGKTDLEITTVGFGAWAIGGGGWAYGWGPQDDSRSIAAIRHAVRRGVNWIDTAAIYGLGHSEEVVGKALREIPAAQRPFVFTKGGMIPNRARPYEEPIRDLRSSASASSGSISISFTGPTASERPSRSPGSR